MESIYGFKPFVLDGLAQSVMGSGTNTDCAHLTILIVREVAFYVKVLIYNMFKISFNQTNIFRNIPL